MLEIIKIIKPIAKYLPLIVYGLLFALIIPMITMELHKKAWMLCIKLLFIYTVLQLIKSFVFIKPCIFNIAIFLTLIVAILINKHNLHIV